MNKFCSNCGTPRDEAFAFCGKCGVKLSMAADITPITKDSLIEQPNNTSAIEQAPGSRTLSFRLLAWISVGLLILGIVVSESAKRSPENSGKVASESVSEYYVFTAKEAIEFWNDSLGVRLNQKDKFSKIVFPSLREKPVFYSAPYYTLLIFPTAESLELDRVNFESDVDFYGNGWVTCSNVAVVFPIARQKELSGANDVFCK